MGTYIEFTKNKWKNKFRYHLADFIPAGRDEPAHWNGYRNQFEFDPNVGAQVIE
jgi:hypothetical protein